MIRRIKGSRVRKKEESVKVAVAKKQVLKYWGKGMNIYHDQGQSQNSHTPSVEQPKF